MNTGFLRFLQTVFVLDYCVGSLSVKHTVVGGRLSPKIEL